MKALGLAPAKQITQTQPAPTPVQKPAPAPVQKQPPQKMKILYISVYRSRARSSTSALDAYASRCVLCAGFRVPPLRKVDGQGWSARRRGRGDGG